MQTGTKEFHELMDAFERAKTMPYHGGHYRRAKDAPAGVFYEHGKVNDLFIAFCHGYALAKAIYTT